MKFVALRQGDVLVVPCKGIPQNVVPIEHDPRGAVLAEGEATGHFHGIALSPRVALFREDGSGGGLYLAVSGDAPVALEHQEHSALSIPPGTYRVVRQRVWSAGTARKVVD